MGFDPQVVHTGWVWMDTSMQPLGNSTQSPNYCTCWTSVYTHGKISSVTLSIKEIVGRINQSRTNTSLKIWNANCQYCRKSLLLLLLIDGWFPMSSSLNQQETTCRGLADINHVMCCWSALYFKFPYCQANILMINITCPTHLQSSVSDADFEASRWRSSHNGSHKH